MKKRSIYIDFLIIFISLLLSLIIGRFLNLGLNSIFLSFYFIDLYFIGKIMFFLSKLYKKNTSNNKLIKMEIEKKKYGYITLIFLLLTLFETFRFACFIVFLIVFLLYLLVTLVYYRSYRYMIMCDDKLLLSDDEFLELYGNEFEECNLFSISFYDEGYNFFNILTDNTFGILDNFENESIVTLLSKLNKSNYVIYLQRSLYFGDVNLFCGLISDYLRRLDINCVVKPSDILKKDNNFISNRRKDFYNTLDNDLKVVDLILKKQKYRIVKIVIYDEFDSYIVLSIVTDSIYKKLVNFRDKQLNKIKNKK